MRRTALSVLAMALPIAAALSVALAADAVDERAVARAAAPPLGLPPLPVPAANPITPAKVALGRRLFLDRRLSRNGTISCAICHVPEQGFAANEMATAVGIEGRSVRRNAPSLLNVGYVRDLFHDGRAPSLEAQALEPLLAHNEMGNTSTAEVVARVRALPDYAGAFERAFGRAADVAALTGAIAAFQRTLLAANSPFDRWYYGGEAAAIGAAAKRGFALFTGAAGCSGCHPIGGEHAFFSDGLFHSTGIGYRNARLRSGDDEVLIALAPGVTTIVKARELAAVSEPAMQDLGRFEVTKEKADAFRYRTPSLRNVALTAPYMHDGSLLTLHEVVYYYARGGIPDPGRDSRIAPFTLPEGGADDLVAFLKSLTGDNIAEIVAEVRSAPVGNP